jgi:hypothetical protein
MSKASPNVSIIVGTMQCHISKKKDEVALQLRKKERIVVAISYYDIYNIYKVHPL